MSGTGAGKFRDLFSGDSAAYARFRPRYPPALFQWLATLPAARRMAWDCATGSGQAATLLAAHFTRVLGTDASLAQLRSAASAPNLAYAAALAEAAPIASGSVDLVAVAQAYHWLDHPRFLAQVDRVAAPGAALAIWGYAGLTTSPEIEAAIRRFHEETVGNYWSRERSQVLGQYRGIQIPIAEVPAPSFAVEATLTLPELLGYIRTWSAVGRYRAALGRDPVDELGPELQRLWGDPDSSRVIVWPLFIRAGRWLGGNPTV